MVYCCRNSKQSAENRLGHQKGDVEMKGSPGVAILPIYWPSWGQAVQPERLELPGTHRGKPPYRERYML